MIFSEGVLHHTDDTESAINNFDRNEPGITPVARKCVE